MKESCAGNLYFRSRRVETEFLKKSRKQKIAQKKKVKKCEDNKENDARAEGISFHKTKVMYPITFYTKAFSLLFRRSPKSPFNLIIDYFS